MNYKFSAGLAFMLEATAWGALFSNLPEEQRFYVYWSAHLFASLLLAWLVYWLLPKRYRRPFIWTYILLFSLQFFIPLIGTAGTLLGVLLALYFPNKSESDPWEEINIPELPFRPTQVSPQPMYSPGALRQILREARSQNKKIKALLATRKLQEREQVEILRQAIKDPEDDVRLLAYSMLEEKEKKISGEIYELQNKLKHLKDTADTHAVIKIKLKLAQLFWDIAYLGIAEHEVKGHYLSACEAILNEILKVDHENPLALRLMGRVKLENGYYADAETYFNRALMHDLPPVQVLPYMAEAAFYQKEFEKVKAYWEQYVSIRRIHPTLWPIIEFWLGASYAKHG